MGYDSSMLRFDYKFLKFKGDPDRDPEEEATEIASTWGSKGYRMIRWFVKETGYIHIAMEKQYRR